MLTIKRSMWLLLPLLAVGTSLTIASSEELRAGVVTGLQGTAKVTRASLTQPRDLGFRDDVYLRDLIVTGDASMARILLGGKALLTVRERSAVKITEAPGVSTVSVSSGRAAVSVMKERMKPGDRVEIVTPNATAAIRGTIVVAEVEADGADTQSTITVLHGLIDVIQHDTSGQSFGQPVSVAAMQQVVAIGKRLSPVQLITRQAADRLSADFKMGLRTAPAPPPPIVQSQMASAVQQITSGSSTTSGSSSSSTSTSTSNGDTSGDTKSNGGGSGTTGSTGGGSTTGGSGSGSTTGGTSGGGTVTTGGGSTGGGSGSGGTTGGTGGGVVVTTGGGSTGGGSGSGGVTGGTGSGVTVSTGGGVTGGGSSVGGTTGGGVTVSTGGGGSTGGGVSGISSVGTSGGGGNSGGGNDRIAGGGGGGNSGGVFDRLIGGNGGLGDRDRDRDDRGNKDRGRRR